MYKPGILIGVLFLCSVASFLVGGIPSGLLIGKLFGERDLSKKGSGNIGATNALRVIGIFPALLTLICDVLKGCLPIIIIRTFAENQLFIAFCGVLAILGHDFSPYLKFRGGKGVATSLGVFLMLSPKAILFSIFIWVVMLLLLKIVSISSIAAGISLPIAIFWLGYRNETLIAGIIASFILIIRHKENIHRLFKGEEKKLSIFKSAT